MQLSGYFNPQAVPMRIMGFLYLPDTVGKQHLLLISHVKTLLDSVCLVHGFPLMTYLILLTFLLSFKEQELMPKITSG